MRKPSRTDLLIPEKTAVGQRNTSMLEKSRIQIFESKLSLFPQPLLSEKTSSITQESRKRHRKVTEVLQARPRAKHLINKQVN